jgi:Amidohydrolase family
MSPSNQTIILGGVTIVDPRDGSLMPNVDITISEGRIVSVTKISAQSATAPGRIGLLGKYVVPGFQDMHAHALNASDPTGALRLMLAFGVTGFRQMSGMGALLAARAAGTLAHGPDDPRLVELPGEILSPANAATVEQALVTLHAEVDKGADFIKVVAVSPAVFTAVQQEARKIGTTISGHLPVASDPVTVSHDGMRSLEHLGPGVVLLAACSSERDSIREILGQAPEIRLPKVKLPFMDRIFAAILTRIVVNPVQRSSADSVQLLQRAIDTFDEARARELAGVFAADGTWNTPTLIRQLTTVECDLPRFPADPDLRYVAPGTLKLWKRTAANFARKFTVEQRATFHAQYELQLRLLKIFDDAGVGLLAGTDATGGVWVIPGASLHHEFDELARAGLSPLRVLQTATWNAAEFLGTTAATGTVEPGKVADLVILEANPVESVDALHGVAGVVLGGRYHSAADLEAMKAGVASARSIS